MDKYKKVDFENSKISKKISFEELKRDLSWKKKSMDSHKKMGEGYISDIKIENCPICETRNIENFVNIYSREYKECKKCGHIYLTDLMSDEAVKNYYEEFEEGSLVYLDQLLFKERIRKISMPKVEWIDKYVADKGTWIDIGSATGEILHSARDLGYEILGVEANESYYEFAKKNNIPTIKKYLNKENSKDIVSDAKVVSLFNVVEHLNDPFDLLKNISRNLNIESYLVIEVPRHPSLSTFNSLCFNNYASRYIYPPGHIHIFTENSMDIMLNKLGLEKVAIWRYGQDVEDLILTMQVVNNVKNNDYTDFLKTKINDMQEAIDRLGLSDNMIVIAKK